MTPPHSLWPPLAPTALLALSLALAGCAGSASSNADAAVQPPTPDASEPHRASAPTPATPTAAPTEELADTGFTGGLTGDGAASAADAESRSAPPLEDLVNADGTSFDLASYRGSPTLIFFGYTHCPDVCPTTIGQLFEVFEARPDVNAIFITVDPERDTAAFLDDWTEFFPENFRAVTGTPGAIRRAADGYGVKYARVETTSTSGYTMSHTADVFVIDPEGRLLDTYPFGTPSEEMIADLARYPAA